MGLWWVVVLVWCAMLEHSCGVSPHLGGNTVGGGHSWGHEAVGLHWLGSVGMGLGLHAVSCIMPPHHGHSHPNSSSQCSPFESIHGTPSTQTCCNQHNTQPAQPPPTQQFNKILDAVTSFIAGGLFNMPRDIINATLYGSLMGLWWVVVLVWCAMLDHSCGVFPQLGGNTAGGGTQLGS